MRFVLSLLGMVLAFCVGVFSEHDFNVVDRARQEVSATCVCNTCKCDTCSCDKCTCGDHCNCCNACPGQK